MLRYLRKFPAGDKCRHERQEKQSATQQYIGRKRLTSRTRGSLTGFEVSLVPKGGNKVGCFKSPGEFPPRGHWYSTWN